MLCLLTVVLSIFLLTACSRNSSDIAVYEEHAANDKIMPTLDELGDYVSAQSLCHRETELFFTWYGWNLIVAYDEENYRIQKAQVEKNYLFKSHPYVPDDGEIHTSRDGCPYEATVGSYFFRGLDDVGYFRYSTYEIFPKLVYMIGFNDTEHKIAFVRFYDFDRDDADDLEELLDDAGWYQIANE